MSVYCTIFPFFELLIWRVRRQCQTPKLIKTWKVCPKVVLYYILLYIVHLIFLFSQFLIIKICKIIILGGRLNVMCDAWCYFIKMWKFDTLSLSYTHSTTNNSWNLTIENRYFIFSTTTIHNIQTVCVLSRRGILSGKLKSKEF